MFYDLSPPSIVSCVIKFLLTTPSTRSGMKFYEFFSSFHCIQIKLVENNCSFRR